MNRPVFSVKTWEEAIEMFNRFTEERDDINMFRKVVKKKIIKETRATCSCIENRIGYGADYLAYTEVTPLYYHE